jgi:phosphohistidine phosphatase SixA
MHGEGKEVSNMHHAKFLYSLAAITALALLLPAQGRSAESLSDFAFVRALQQGGKVIVMRHAKSPHASPNKDTAAPGNNKLERQLDETGRSTAAAMGDAFRRLNIPIAGVFSSPTYRALETVRRAQFPNPRVCTELGNAGHGMREASGDESQWLKRHVMRWSERGNAVFVTHSPNIKAAFPQFAQGLGSGEALVFEKDGHGGINLLKRIKIEEWPALAGK